jgi:hypothetical protein
MRLCVLDHKHTALVDISTLRTPAMNGHSSGERFVLVAPMAN